MNSTSVTAAAGDNQKKEREKNTEKECGKCPLCKTPHTFYNNKENQLWPADRFYKCEEFKKLSVKDRASTLER